MTTMLRFFNKTFFIAFAIIYISMAASKAMASENLLISSQNVLYEYSIAGVQLQSIYINYPGDSSIEEARDIVQAQSGDVYVFNGNFEPYLSILAQESSTWSHHTFSGWSIVNNGSYGGIAATDSHIFVTDMDTYGAEDIGVIRFDLDGANPIRFAKDIEPIDLTIGLDGMLYVLYPGGSPGGRFINVYNPDTLAFVKQVSLADIFGHTEHRTIAVNTNGDIFIADWDGEVHHVNAAGELLDTINPECNWSGSPTHCEFLDIDISASGLLALGTRYGEVMVTNIEFSSISTFDVGNNGIFVAFGSDIVKLKVNKNAITTILPLLLNKNSI